MAKKLRIQITIDPDIDARLEAFAKDYGTTKSGVISMAITQFMDAQEKLPEVIQQINLLGQLGESMQLKKTK